MIQVGSEESGKNPFLEVIDCRVSSVLHYDDLLQIDVTIETKETGQAKYYFSSHWTEELIKGIREAQEFYDGLGRA